MAEPEGQAPAPTDAQEAPPSEEAKVEETPTYITLEDAKALLDQTWAERETNIRKDLEAAYKTLRRGEAKSDQAQKRIDKLEAELLEVSLRGLEPAQVEVEKLRRQVQRDADSRSAPPDPDAEVAAFKGWSSSYLEEEQIGPDDPVLKASFQRYADGWQGAADLRVALTRAVADVRKEQAKAARSEAAEREKKAREDERAKLRNEKRAEDGKVDKGAAAPASASPVRKNWLAAPPEEWEALKSQRGLRR